MLAKIDKAAFEKLHEVLQSEYVPQADGTYLAKIDPVDGLALEDVQGLKNTVATLRTEARTKDATINKFGDLDPEAAREALAKVKALGTMSLDEKVAEAVKQRETAIIAKHQEDLKKLSDVSEARKAQLRKVLIDNVVLSSLEANDDKTVLPLYIKQRVDMRENADGSMVAVVLDENGNEAIGDSQGNPMTVNQFVSTLRGKTEFARYFGGTGASGTGASGNAGGKPGGVHVKNGVKQVSADDYTAIQANLEGIQKGEIEVVPGNSSPFGSDQFSQQ